MLQHDHMNQIFKFKGSGRKAIKSSMKKRVMMPVEEERCVHKQYALMSEKKIKQ